MMVSRFSMYTKVHASYLQVFFFRFLLRASFSILPPLTKKKENLSICDIFCPCVKSALPQTEDNKFFENFFGFSAEFFFSISLQRKRSVCLTGGLCLGGLVMDVLGCRQLSEQFPDFSVLIRLFFPQKKFSVTRLYSNCASV
uniref:Putative secreted protein n=1 Tax=Ixodes ricinus TaxID=34613 RepID=A0A6B0UTW8_IXORI